MKARSCLVVWLLPLLWLSAAPAANARDTDPPELKWARGIADDFWKALIDREPYEAAGLLSPELTQSYSAQDIHKAAGSYLASFIEGKDGIKSVLISSAEMAPDRSEAIFRGTVSGKLYDSAHPEAKQDFTMRVAKEAGGRWSIRFLRLKEHQKEAKKSSGSN